VTHSPVLLGLAAVLAGTTAILAIFGVVYNPILFVAATPFGAATYVVWRHVTGRLTPRRRERVSPFDAARGARDAGAAGRRDTGGPGGSRAGRRARTGEGAGPEAAETQRLREAARLLDVDPDADADTIRAAYRERARELHPDAPDGDADAFQDVRAAYDRLTSNR